MWIHISSCQLKSRMLFWNDQRACSCLRNKFCWTPPKRIQNEQSPSDHAERKGKQRIEKSIVSLQVSLLCSSRCHRTSYNLWRHLKTPNLKYKLSTYYEVFWKGVALFVHLFQGSYSNSHLRQMMLLVSSEILSLMFPCHVIFSE